jgi:hypothetical protein
MATLISNASFFLLDGYRRVGRFYSHGIEISDILRTEGAGFAVLAIAVVGVGVLLERLLRRL